MTTPNENDVQGQEVEQPYVAPDSGTDDSGSQQQNQEDIYAPYLEKFPTSLHSIARDVFKEWDGNVTQRLQKVHSEYEPYKAVIDQYEPEALQTAVQIAEALDSDPQGFYTALAEAYGFTTAEQGQQVAEALTGQPHVGQVPQGQQQNPLDAYDPITQRLNQQEQLLQTMGEALLAERQQQQEMLQMQQEDELYEQTMTALEEAYGPFDQAYVNALLAQGYDPEQAVAQWQQAVGQYAQQQLAPNQQAPVVMGAGGGTPSIQRDTENLSSQETRRLVEEMLRAGAESNRS